MQNVIKQNVKLLRSPLSSKEINTLIFSLRVEHSLLTHYYLWEIKNQEIAPQVALTL